MVSVYITQTRETYLGRNENLNRSGLEEALNDSLILFAKRLMIQTNATLQGVHQATIANVIKMRLDIRQLRVEELVLVVVRTAVDEKVLSGQTALLAPRNENDDRPCRRVPLNGEISRFRHGNHE
jgi:hypothetical protein